MEQTLSVMQVVQEMVLNPNLGSSIILFFSSFLNELLGLFPYAVVLSGQLVFLEGNVTSALLAKLFVFVAIPVGVGSALGTLPVYVLSYFGGKPAIEKWGRHLRFSWKDVEKVSTRFQGAWYDELVFLLLRCLPILPSLPLNIAVGVLRMRFLPYLVLTTFGFIIRMMLTLLIVGLGTESLSSWLHFLYNDSTGSLD